MKCPFCKTKIPDSASKCPNCTQDLTFHKHPVFSFILLGIALISFSMWTLWFPPLSILLLVIGIFFILMGVLFIFKKPMDRFVKKHKKKEMY